MDVSIVEFPETSVAMISHIGSPASEHDTVMKLVQWKIQNGFLDQDKHRHYGLHYLPPDPPTIAQHRVDFCLSIDRELDPNELGIEKSVIPSLRCALARDVGSRMNNQAARFLLEDWFPESGESLFDHPLIFHYVNVGPDVGESEAITDVYLPLR